MHRCFMRARISDVNDVDEDEGAVCASTDPTPTPFSMTVPIAACTSWFDSAAANASAIDVVGLASTKEKNYVFYFF